MTVHIIGAGMAGLLAGAMFRRGVEVHEAADKLPNNHHALLRFRSDEIAHHLNIEFSEVEVMKIVKPWRNKVADAAAYSLKSNGKASLRSIRSAEGKVDRRFIAPPDFIQVMAEMQPDIEFGCKVDRDLLEWFGKQGPIISTIPMGSLMQALNYPDVPAFASRSGWVVKAEVHIPSDLCATIYYPDPDVPVIRATLTGTLLQIEMVESFDRALWAVDRIMEHVLPDFGIHPHTSHSAELVQQRYAKILPIGERERRKFIMWATDEFGIYSLGRFAVWKPGLLLDDVFHDCQKIISMIREGHNYHGRLPKANQLRSV